MKPKWKDDEIKKLLNFVEVRNKKNIPLLKSFTEYANATNRQPLSVRNFYYSLIKMIKSDNKLQNKYKINLNFHNISKFEHFSEAEENKLKYDIENFKKQGFSTREACIKLSDGDMTKMLRIHNKYRNIKEKENKKFNSKNTDNQATIYKFPTIINTKKEKIKLTDEDIKSLFMGLVNLVKENAKNDNQEKYEVFLQKTEEDKRRHFIELEQKQFEIDRLNQSINELKAKNISLNKCLENYRINYLNNFKPND